jgi:hypothetical protein
VDGRAECTERQRKCIFQWESLRRRNILENLVADRRTIVNLVLKEADESFGL